MTIFGGVIGAVLGFVAGIFAYEVLGRANKYDPITSGMIALLFWGPVGAVAETVLGAKLAMMATRPRNGGGSAADGWGTAGEDVAARSVSLTKSSLKSLGIVLCEIRLTDKAPHMAEFGRWEPNPDGSEIRYRAKWPGRG